MEFRLLRADEIECRVSTCNQYGVGILLYKDARCDMNILDETVGCLNWQRRHTRDNANCIVSIWDESKKMWIEKEDTGTESFTEAEKGLASDSFKRACFCVGIGRELYTAPNMFVMGKDLKTHKKNEANGKWDCKDVFKVTEIEYDGRKIARVKILNLKNNVELEFGTPTEVAREQEQIARQTIDATKVSALINRCEEDGVPQNKILQLYKVSSLSQLTERQFANIHANWDKIKGE